MAPANGPARTCPSSRTRTPSSIFSMHLPESLSTFVSVVTTNSRDGDLMLEGQYSYISDNLSGSIPGGCRAYQSDASTAGSLCPGRNNRQLPRGCPGAACVPAGVESDDQDD